MANRQYLLKCPTERAGRLYRSWTFEPENVAAWLKKAEGKQRAREQTLAEKSATCLALKQAAPPLVRKLCGL
jgi:hypothetical protein